MRLITHNYLQSNVKGTTKGYPLKIVTTKVTITDTPVNIDLVLKMIPKLKYDALVAAVNELRQCMDSNECQVVIDGGNDDDDGEQQQQQSKQVIPTIPDTLPPPLHGDEGGEENSSNDQKPAPAAGSDDAEQPQKQNNTQLLENLYQVLFNVHVEDGYLQCPDTKRKFPILQGIPNMILHEDEI